MSNARSSRTTPRPPSTCRPRRLPRRDAARASAAGRPDQPRCPPRVGRPVRRRRGGGRARRAPASRGGGSGELERGERAVERVVQQALERGAAHEVGEALAARVDARRRERLAQLRAGGRPAASRSPSRRAPARRRRRRARAPASAPPRSGSRAGATSDSTHGTSSRASRCSVPRQAHVRTTAGSASTSPPPAPRCAPGRQPRGRRVLRLHAAHRRTTSATPPRSRGSSPFAANRSMHSTESPLAGSCGLTVRRAVGAGSRRSGHCRRPVA